MVVINKDSLKIASYDWFPSWSPDGKRIAFASDRKGDLVNFEIYVMDADGEVINKDSLNNRRYDWDPSWSSRQ